MRDARTFGELARRDQRLRTMLIILVIFVLLPPLFSYFKDPYGWKGDEVQMIALGFGAPYLVLAFLIARRWRTLSRLSARGVTVTGTVEKSWSTRDSYRATVRYAFAGEEHRVTLDLPADTGLALEGSSATVLVDPSKPRRASIIEVGRPLRD